MKRQLFSLGINHSIFAIKISFKFFCQNPKKKEKHRKMNPQNGISFLISEIDSIITSYERLVPKAMICRNQLQEFLDIVREHRNALKQFNINAIRCNRDPINEILNIPSDEDFVIREVASNTLAQILELCGDFRLLLQLCQKLIFPRVSLELDPKSIFLEIHRFIHIFFEQLIKINVYPPDKNEQVISKESIKKDLNDLKTTFLQCDLDRLPEAKRQLYQERLKAINDMYAFYKFGNPIEPTVPKTNFFSHSQSWQFDDSQLIIDQHEMDISKPDQFILSSAHKNIEGSDEIVNYLVLSVTNQSGIAEKESNKIRRLLLLMALRSPYLLKCVGGVIPKEEGKPMKVVYESKIAQTILEYRRKGASYTNLSKTIYFIAVALQYLQNREIIHGHITSRYIFQQENNIIIPALWNFGLLTPLDLRRAPPEWITKHEYTSKSDVYQYGLLLWEIAERRDSFSAEEANNVEGMFEIITDVEKRRKHFTIDPNNASPKLQQLISDILYAESPEDRPDFLEITQRFLSGEIYFIDLTHPGGLDHFKQAAAYFGQLCRAKEMKTILLNLRKQGNNTNNPLFILFKDLGISLSEEKFDENKLGTKILEKAELIVTFVNLHLNNPEYLEQILDMNLFAYITPHLFDQPNKAALVQMYISLSQLGSPEDPEGASFSNKFVQNFLHTGGIEFLTQALHANNPENEELLSQLIDGMLHALPNTACAALVKHAIDTGHLSIACKLVDKGGRICAVQVLSQELPQLCEFLQQEDHMVNASILIQDCLTLVDNPVEIQNVSISSVIKSGNLSLLRTLLKHPLYLNSITMNDSFCIIEILIDSKATVEQKDCALFFGLGLGAPFYQQFAQYNKLIDIVINHENQQIASRFIARLCRYPNACVHLLSEFAPFFVQQIKSPFYLVALSRIAGFYPARVCQDNSIREAILDNLKNLDQIEATVRLLGTLSGVQSYWEDGKMAESLIQILLSNSATVFETILILSVLSNVATYYDMNKHLFVFISYASAQTEIAGIASRIISQLNILSQTDSLRNKAIASLIPICKVNVEHGDDFAKEACSKILLNMINSSPSIRSVLSKKGLPLCLANGAANENNPHVFISMMEALAAIGVANIPVTSLFDEMQIRAQLQLPRSFYTLRQKICNPDYSED